MPLVTPVKCNLEPGNYLVVISSSVLGEEAPLDACRPSSVAVGDPNNDVDNDSNALLLGDFITSSTPIVLTLGGEPLENRSVNLSVDFGFHCVVPAVPNTGVPTVQKGISMSSVLTGLGIFSPIAGGAVVLRRNS